jgi:large subunit ribosomal protein L30
MARIAIVRMRGNFGISPDVEKTLESLRLVKNNFCALVPDDPSHKGMVGMCKDFVAWGEVKEATVAKLLLSRGKSAKKLDAKSASETAKQFFAGKSLKELGIEPVFRLSPPRKGYGGTKAQQPYGGLGKREDMDELLLRMI